MRRKQFRVASDSFRVIATESPTTLVMLDTGDVWRVGATLVGSLHITVVQDVTPPTVPTGLTATGMSETSIVLSWGASVDTETGVASYEIYRDGVLVGTVAGP